MKTAEVRPFIEKFLQGFLRSPGRVIPDADGDYTFRSGSAGIGIAVHDQAPGFVTIFSPLVQGVDKTQALLEDLNEINSRYCCSRVYWKERAVILQVDLLPSGLDEEEMTTACSLAAELADALDTALQMKHGGRTVGRDEDDKVPKA